ncbi:MAG: hypothetical protein VYA88_01835 [Actinomycetota bacterium]|nr:hypothetical protein [Actinomycetota bacterium]
MIGGAVWGWAFIGLVAALGLIGVVVLWQRMKTAVEEEAASSDSQRWWFRLFRNTQIDEENPDQIYIAALLEDIKDKPA